MAVFIEVYLLLSLSTATLCYADHKIYVNSQTGVKSTSCWKTGYSTPCHSLNLALQEAQNHYSNSIAIHLQPGQHQLHSGIGTQLRNMSQLAIVGNSSQGEVVIRCEPLAGLAFYQSDYIEMRNVSIVGCGAVQSSTSRNPISGELIKIQVAVFIQSTNNINLTNVEVTNSTGTGLVLYNTEGHVYVNGCTFSHNGPTNNSFGGGALVFESSSDSHPAHFILEKTKFINNTSDNTANNMDFSALVPSNDLDKYFGIGRGGGISVVFRGGAANNIVQFSGVRLESNRAPYGGGAYLALHGNASNNMFTMNDCTLINNAAKSKYTERSYKDVRSYLETSKGGGMLISFVSHYGNQLANNYIAVNNTEFNSNEGDIGGGLAVDIPYGSYNDIHDTGNILSLSDCVFNRNIAFMGSSAYLFQGSNGERSLVNVEVSSTSFTHGTCFSRTSFARRYGYLTCSGSVFLQKGLLLMKDEVVFSNNKYSAVELHSGFIKLSPGARLSFTNNSGAEGAALKVLDCSSVIVDYNTSMVFDSNVAISRGGAVYFESCDASLSGGSQCFVRHRMNLHPNDWKTNLTFSDNLASNSSNSIFLNNIRSCIWPPSQTPLDLNSALSKLFNWTGWYCTSQSDDNCHDGVDVSAVLNVDIDESQSVIFPGETLTLKVFLNDVINQFTTQKDEFFNLQVQTGPGIFAQNSRSITTSLDMRNETRVKLFAPNCSDGYDKECTYLEVQSDDVFNVLKVTFQLCKTATQWNGPFCLESINGNNGQCVQQLHPMIGCGQCSLDDTRTEYEICPLDSTICIPEDRCLSKQNDSLVVGYCPPLYHSLRSQNCSSDELRMQNYSLNKLRLQNYSLNELNTFFLNVSNVTCAPHREGTLCGRCTEGYGVAINDPDFKCVECDTYNGIAIFLFLELVPILLLMISMAILHINITNGSLNGYILYSQLLTLQFPGLGFPSWVFQRTMCHYFQLIIYSIWNLNFLVLSPVPFCIPNVESAEKAIALQYLIAVLPLLFIAGTYIWIKMYNRGYKGVVCLTRPVHQLLARFWGKVGIKLSLIDTYAGLLLLSYMRFLEVSVKLLQYTVVLPAVDPNQTSEVAFYYNADLVYFGWPHALLGVFALLCLLVCVVLPVVVLLFYHLKIFQQCLTLCMLSRPGLHALVDAYQGCFKNIATDGVERRYFAGIYLLFRMCVLFLIIPEVSSFRMQANLSIFSPTLLIEMIAGIILAGMVSLLRPYKKMQHNVTDLLILLVLSILPGFVLTLDGKYALSTTVLVYFPGIGLICYFIFHLFKLCFEKVKCNCKLEKKRTHSELAQSLEVPLVDSSTEEPPVQVIPTSTVIRLDEFVPDEIFPDRMINPDGYRK